MKFTFLILTMMTSLASWSSTEYLCRSEKGSIHVTDNMDKGVIINFGEHEVTDLDYFGSSYADLVTWDNVATDNKLKTTVTIIPNQVQKGGFFDGFKFSNSERKIIANSSGSQDFSSFKVKFSLNKKTLKANIYYNVGIWPGSYGKLNDNLSCGIL